MDFGGLAVRISCRDTLAECLQAAHLCHDPAPGVVSRPAFPEGPAVVPGGAQGFVSDLCRRAVFFPRPAILADRDNRGGTTLDDGGVATARVIGSVCDHAADLFVLRKLIEQFRQGRAVTVATGGELESTDVGRGSIHRKMHLAPLAPPLNAVLAGLPLAIAKELDPGAVHQQVPYVSEPRYPAKMLFRVTAFEPIW